MLHINLFFLPRPWKGVPQVSVLLPDQHFQALYNLCESVWLFLANSWFCLLSSSSCLAGCIVYIFVNPIGSFRFSFLNSDFQLNLLRVWYAEIAELVMLLKMKGRQKAAPRLHCRCVYHAWLANAECLCMFQQVLIRSFQTFKHRSIFLEKLNFREGNRV